MMEKHGPLNALSIFCFHPYSVLLGCLCQLREIPNELSGALLVNTPLLSGRFCLTLLPSLITLHAASPETWTLAGRQSGRRGSAPNGLVNGFGFGGGFIEMPGGVAGGWERGTGEEREGVGMEVKDSENYRLCCPECGFDLLKADMVDTLQKEKVGKDLPDTRDM